MWAPRAVANSRSSRISAPAPSPRTKPSRVRSNGRETSVWERPSRGDPSPRMLPKPAWATSSSGISVEPAMIVWTSPRRMISAASPIEFVPVEQAVTTQMLWPIAPVSMAIMPEVESTRPLAMNVGATRLGPFSARIFQLSIMRFWPPAPEPNTTPMSSRFSSVISRPASATACFAAATPYHIDGSERRTALWSIHAAASKSLTSPAQRAAYGVGSNFVMTSSPDWPLSRAAQAVSLSLPTGLITPRPVTTTRRVKSGWRMFLSVLWGAGGAGDVGVRGYGRRPPHGSAVDRGGVGEGERESVRRGPVVGRERDRLGCDPADEPGQHLARPDLDAGRHAGGTHRLDGADPVDARRQVIDELGTAGVCRRECVGIGVCEQRRRRIAEGDAREHPRHAGGGVGHQRRVRRDADRKLDRPLRAELLRDRHGRLDRRALAGDDDLSRRVAVRDAEDAVRRRPLDELGEACIVQADQGGHTTLAPGAR